MRHDEFQGGEAAPNCDAYELLNVFGTPTGQVVVVVKGETFPAVPRGYTYRSLATHSAAELRAKASHYRRMAGTATTAAATAALLNLAGQLDAMADRRERPA